MTSLERALLWLGVEDYTSLWDAAAEAAADVSDPRLTRWEAVTVAAKVLAGLAAQGFITLHRCQEPLGNGAIEDVPQEHYESALAVGPHWEPPRTGALSIRFLTTDAGRMAYDDSA